MSQQTQNSCYYYHLNDYFSNVASDLMNNSALMAVGNPMSFLTSDFRNSFSYHPVLPEEINSVILSLKNKSNNIYCIPVKVLKKISYIISPILASITNNSVFSGTFPSMLKLANVIPLHKKGPRNVAANYRPISILPSFSKIIEKIVYKRVYNYLMKFSILSNDQFGFRSGKSTSMAILHFLHCLYPSLDSDKSVISVFLDFSKVFDCVSHSILLYKLHFYGFRGFIHDWFKSYLSGRKQRVTLGDVSSGYVDVVHGVPQGSVLGPLMFLLFINDLPSVSNKFKYTLFADDSTLSYSFDPRTDIQTAHVIVNNELSKINNWLLVNKIKINIEKTNCVLFNCRRNVELPDVVIGGGVVNRVDTIRFLGVVFDENLKFNSHINYISGKVSRTVGLLNKLKHYVPMEVLHLIYNSLIAPYLNYCIEIWGGTSACYLDKLLKIQKAAIRNVNLLSFNAHTSTHFKNLNILKIPDLYEYHVLVLMHKAVFRNDNLYLFSDLRSHRDLHSYLTRNSLKLLIPHFRKTKCHMSISFVGPSLWNRLPESIKTCTSLVTFKNKIRNKMIVPY